MAHDGTNTKKRVKESKANNKKPTWKAMGDGETRDGSRKARERERKESENITWGKKQSGERRIGQRRKVTHK